uniref:Uncharacterized protein n=1 Tax=Anguilla anguilla TaxID=7936 RepID=A0A0E9XIB2_ANGAN
MTHYVLTSEAKALHLWTGWC